MTTAAPGRHRLVARLGVLGGGLGLVAGVIQASVGSRIPEWTGNKADPVPLGLLTIALSLLAIVMALWQRRSGPATAARGAAALALLVPGLLCFTTVGRLWFLPAALLLPAAAMAVDDWRGTAAAVGRNWSRCLLAALGAIELLMAAGATPLLMIVASVGGLALITAAWLPGPSRPTLVGLLVVGTVPFAVLAWTAIVPVLLLVVTAGIAAPLIPRSGPGESVVGHGDLLGVR